MLAEAFVITKEEELVLLDGTAQRAAEAVAPEWRDGALVEEIARVERAIAQEFVERAVQAIAAGGRDDADLRAGALAVFGAVGVGDHVEFAHPVHAQQLAAGASRGIVDHRSAGKFHPVQQEEILLRAAARDGEHVAHRRTGGAHASRTLGGVVDDAGVEGDQLVVAAAVQRQISDLAFIHQPGDLLRGLVHRRSGGLHRDHLLQFPHRQREIHHRGLADHQVDPGFHLRGEARFFGGDLVMANGDGRSRIAAAIVGNQLAFGAGLQTFHGDSGGGNGRARFVFDGP